MEITSSFAVEIIGSNAIFRDTIKLYRSALAYLIGVVNERWNELDAYKSTKQKMSHIERLVHTTKQHAAVYDFDQRFYKMPTYLRRAATTAAIGCVSSYKSNLANWEKDGKKGKTPRLQTERFAMPTFYKDNMYTASSNPNEAYLKLYHQNDWVRVKVHLKGTDVRYIQRYWSHCKASAPTLEKKHGKYFLRFAFVENVPPTISAAKAAQIIKTNTSRILMQEFEPLSRMGVVWTRSYFASTAGEVSAQTIQKYIESQKKRG